MVSLLEILEINQQGLIRSLEDILPFEETRDLEFNYWLLFRLLRSHPHLTLHLLRDCQLQLQPRFLFQILLMPQRGSSRLTKNLINHLGPPLHLLNGDRNSKDKTLVSQRTKGMSRGQFNTLAILVYRLMDLSHLKILALTSPIALAEVTILGSKCRKGNRHPISKSLPGHMHKTSQ